MNDFPVNDCFHASGTDEAKRVAVRIQYAQALKDGTITCGCGLLRDLLKAYRCYYCGQWYCDPCAAAHFGMTRQQYSLSKTYERHDTPAPA